MTDSRSLAPNHDDAEVRLELTTAEVRQVWALYSRPLRGSPSPAKAEREAAETSLAAFLGELRPLAWRWRRTLALCSVAGMALGVIYLLLATPTFGVRALVLVEQRGTSVPDAASAHGDSAFLAGQAEILGGASIVREALIRSKPGSSREEPRRVDRLAAWLPLSARAPEQAEREELARALGALSALPIVGTEVIALEYRTQDPASGVHFVQAVIDGYGEFAHTLRSGEVEVGVSVRTLAAPARQAGPLWPRPAPVLFSCLVLGLLAGLALALLAERAEQPEADWTELREAAWAG